MLNEKSPETKLFILGNNYLPLLSRLYNTRHATQAEIASRIGFFGRIKDYFEYINFQPDLLLIVDDSLPLTYCGLEELDIPVAGYLIDSHLHLDWHRHFAAAMDVCFVAQLNCSETIRYYQPNTSWLPLFAPDDLIINSERNIDICFVGTLDERKNPERVRFINEFRNLHPLTVVQGGYQETYNRSRIILNQSVWDDINFRVFEAMACGGMLLTEENSNGLERLFSNECHLVTYKKGDVLDAVAKVRYLLQNPEILQIIATNGHLETTAKHTAEARGLFIHKMLQKQLVDRKNRGHKKEALKKVYATIAARYKNDIVDKPLSEYCLNYMESL